MYISKLMKLFCSMHVLKLTPSKIDKINCSLFQFSFRQRCIG